MTVTYIIDGYNLLHAMGVLSGRVGPHGLEKARARLLGLLHGSMEQDAERVTVVFDAAGALPGGDREQRQHGIKVIFAQGRQEADDVIEQLIKHASAPKQLEVVSNDHRLRQAARKRRSVAKSCDEFLTWLARHRRETHKEERQRPEKQQQLGEHEINRWLAEFGDLETDPTLRKAFESFDFEEEA